MTATGDSALHGRLVATIPRITRLMRRQISQHTQLPTTGWRLLVRLVDLADSPDRPETQAELAAELCLSPSAFTRLVDRMARAGLVRRMQGASRRAHTIVVRPRGAAEWRRLKRVIQTEFARVFAGIPQRDLRVADRVLGLIRTHLETHARDRKP